MSSPSSSSSPPTACLHTSTIFPSAARPRDRSIPSKPNRLQQPTLTLREELVSTLPLGDDALPPLQRNPGASTPDLRRGPDSCGQDGPAHCRAGRGLRVRLSLAPFRAFVSIFTGASTDRLADFVLPDSYEALPPNFSLVQNMTAGAFAGIAVWCPLHMRSCCVGVPPGADHLRRNILSCTLSTL